MEDVEKTVITDDSQVDESTETLIQEEQTAGETPAKSEVPNSEEDKIEAEIQKRLEKRIKRFTAEKYALKEQLKQEKLKNQDLSQKPAPPNPAKFVDGYGNVNQDEYLKAFAEYEDRRDIWKESQSKVKEDDQELKNEVIRHQGKFLEKGAKLAEKYPDWFEIINKPIWTADLTSYLQITENAELALYLGKHEEEAKRIGALPIHEMESELEAIEAKMKSPVRKAQPTPKPITPVDDGGYTSVNIDEDKMTDQQWADWRKSERLKRRG